jgi:glycosyltransferase 2 family protein
VERICFPINRTSLKAIIFYFLCSLMPGANLKNLLKFFFKIVVTAVCLWYISRKINWHETLQLVVNSNPLWLLVSVLLFTVSKVISSFRLNVYFHNMDAHLAEKQNLKLYWLGMFYNLFLPGSISGDAYKVILLNRKYKYSAKLLTAAVLLDRISGVMGMGILAVIFYFLIQQGAQYSNWALIALMPGIIIYYFFVKKVFPTFLRGVWKTFWLGLLVQAFIVMCAYSIMAAIHINQSREAYVLVFLFSSLVAILPLSVGGGLGIREFAFLSASKVFHLDQHQAITISLLYYFVIVISSIVGVRWVYKDPLE